MTAVSQNIQADPSLNALQRASGKAVIAFKLRHGATVIKDLYQQGSAKVRLPKTATHNSCEAVLINTSGGMTDNDKFTTKTTWEAGTSAIVTTQAAERIYKSRAAHALITNELHIKEKAHAFWLPQETILFNAGRFARTCTVNIEKNGLLLACESLVFGRTAMGEAISLGNLSERWQVRYDNKLIFTDHMRLTGDIFTQLQKPAIANGAKAWSTVLLVSEMADQYQSCIRALATVQNTEIGCSVRGPLLVIRILGQNGHHMRKLLTVVLETLVSKVNAKNNAQHNMTEQQLPRVWYC